MVDSNFYVGKGWVGRGNIGCGRIIVVIVARSGIRATVSHDRAAA
jgi:hypothetical protein